MTWTVPLADVVISEEEIAAIADTYRSGWLSMGPETAQFERAFAKAVMVRHAFAVSSGTAALHLLLAANEIGSGDEVIVPSMTFVATVNAVAYTGATPVFCDIAAVTEPWLSAELVKETITERTKAILVMPYGGHPGDVARLVALAQDRRILLLIDAAHAIDATVSSGPVGALGDGAAFSFFSNKNLAVGEGGMVVTNHDDVAERIGILRSHGMTTLTWDRHRGHASSYDVVAPGYNYRIDEPRSTLGRLRLARLPDETRQRARVVDRYRAALDETPGAVPTASVAPAATASHHLFTVVLNDDVDRDALRARLIEDGIQTSVHYPPVHRFSIYAQHRSDLPCTDAYGARTLTLPLFAHMTDQQVDIVVQALRNALRDQRRLSAIGNDP